MHNHTGSQPFAFVYLPPKETDDIHTSTDTHTHTVSKPSSSLTSRSKSLAHGADVPLQCHWLCLQPAGSDEVLSSVWMFAPLSFPLQRWASLLSPPLPSLLLPRPQLASSTIQVVWWVREKKRRRRKRSVSWQGAAAAAAVCDDVCGWWLWRQTVCVCVWGERAEGERQDLPCRYQSCGG